MIKRDKLGIEAFSGFMSCSVEGLIHAYKSTWCNEKYATEDVNAVPVPWRDELFDDTKYAILNFQIN